MCNYSWVSWTGRPQWVYQDPGNVYSGFSPVQDNCPDCYLHAALSSLAWVTPTAGVIKNYDRIRFYNVNVWRSMPATSSENLPLSGDQFAFGRSSNLNVIWPAIYEKMYAKFLGIASCTHHPGEREISQMPSQYNPLETLGQVTGWSKSSIAANDSNLWSRISGMTSGNKMCYPMVALTKPNFTAVTRNLVIPVHAYSVFGIYSNLGRNYLVLRNPLANLAANTGIDMITSTTSWAYTDYCYGRNAQQLLNNGSKTETFSLSKGLFALNLSEVSTYFDWFGYVY